jgi:hypothetical protein
VKSLDKDTKFPNYLKVKITGENKWTCKEVKKGKQKKGKLKRRKLKRGKQK